MNNEKLISDLKLEKRELLNIFNFYNENGLTENSIYIAIKNRIIEIETELEKF